MARLMALHGDPAVLPREQVPGGPTTTLILANTLTAILPTFDTSSVPPTLVTATSQPLITDPTASSQTILQTISVTSSSNTGTPPTASSTSTAAASGGSSISGTTLAEIIAPIAFVVILVPIIYMLWVRHRTRNMNKLESEPRHSPSPSKEPKFSSAPPMKRRSFKPSFLPPLFLHERGQAKETSLSDEVRVSMESAQRKESVNLFDRNNDFRGKESSYGVYSLRRSLEDKGRTDSIGLFDLSRSNDRSSPSQPIQRGPSPTLPSPKVPLFDRPPSEAWPLPASKLPDPPALYDSHLNTKKSLPTYTSPSNSTPPNMPLPNPPRSRQENPTHSFASSNVLPQSPTHQYKSSTSSQPNSGYNNLFGSNSNPQYLPGSAGDHSETNHLLNPSTSSQHQNMASLDSPSSVYNTPAVATFSPLSLDEHRGRQRDSDLVSELSYRSPSSDRDRRRTSADAISVVSAISHRRRRSDRDADALSMISALSPDSEDPPRIPIEHYPLT
ncbi:MAG: hypothetical protein GOMPHAMPRED_005851 [Gomphillus americanus]|uniref:Uncharacterized protein n=1 Tax=Gomphillus americanus TaxID=1940652 RepID=A0A8H3G126_9LECA|nr:MAG: hypothetical protein GOMPHAMPRED_005851 [Gomphillus americanus]